MGSARSGAQHAVGASAARPLSGSVPDSFPVQLKGQLGDRCALHGVTAL